MNLGELAPYVVRADHDGVELELPVRQEVPFHSSEGGCLTVILLVPFLLPLFLLWAFLGAAAPPPGPPKVVWMRLERRQLIFRNYRLSTRELQRVDPDTSSLKVVRTDGSTEILQLRLKPAFLAALARILTESAARDGTTSHVPQALRELTRQVHP